MAMRSWSISGSDAHEILGDVHIPESKPRGVVLLAHGFKGYKDYGLFPRLAYEISTAGFIAHRFNFSHSGMTNDLSTFSRPDLFERDTWNKQIKDIRTVTDAVNDGRLDGKGLPCVIYGHSRGGVSALLTAGRFVNDPTFPQPTGIISVAAPCTCNSLTDEEQKQLLEQGFLISPSARTGQILRVGKDFLQDQLDDPKGHDLLRIVGQIKCTILIVHGANDPTVPVEAATILRDAATSNVRLEIIPGANHVFNAPNPMPEDADPSPQLRQLIDVIVDFLNSI